MSCHHGHPDPVMCSHCDDERDAIYRDASITCGICGMHSYTMDHGPRVNCDHVAWDCDGFTHRDDSFLRRMSQQVRDDANLRLQESDRIDRWLSSARH